MIKDTTNYVTLNYAADYHIDSEIKQSGGEYSM